MPNTLNKKEAMLYVIKHNNGNFSELEQKIGKERIREFEYLGYIKNGISNTEKTYQGTENVIKDYEIFYGSVTCRNFIPNFLFGSIFKFKY